MKKPENTKNEWSAPLATDRNSVHHINLSSDAYPTERGTSAPIVAARIKWAMAKCRCSYRKMAEAIGCSYTLVAFVANGENSTTKGPVMTSLGMIELMAQYLGVNPEWLAFGLGIPSDSKDRSEPSWLIDYYAADAAAVEAARRKSDRKR